MMQRLGVRPFDVLFLVGLVLFTAGLCLWSVRLALVIDGAMLCGISLRWAVVSSRTAFLQSPPLSQPDP